MLVINIYSQAYIPTGEYPIQDLFSHANASLPARDECRAVINGWDHPSYFRTASYREAILSMILLKKVTDDELLSSVDPVQLLCLPT